MDEHVAVVRRGDERAHLRGGLLRRLDLGREGTRQIGSPLVGQSTDGPGSRRSRDRVREDRTRLRTFSARDDFDVSLSRRACRRARFASSIAIVRDSLPSAGGRGRIVQKPDDQKSHKRQNALCLIRDFSGIGAAQSSHTASSRAFFPSAPIPSAHRRDGQALGTQGFQEERRGRGDVRG